MLGFVKWTIEGGHQRHLSQGLSNRWEKWNDGSDELGCWEGLVEGCGVEGQDAEGEGEITGV